MRQQSWRSQGERRPSEQRAEEVDKWRGQGGFTAEHSVDHQDRHNHRRGITRGHSHKPYQYHHRPFPQYMFTSKRWWCHIRGSERTNKTSFSDLRRQSILQNLSIKLPIKSQAQVKARLLHFLPSMLLRTTLAFAGSQLSATSSVLTAKMTVLKAKSKLAYNMANLLVTTSAAVARLITIIVRDFSNDLISAISMQKSEGDGEVFSSVVGNMKPSFKGVSISGYNKNELKCKYVCKSNDGCFIQNRTRRRWLKRRGYIV